MDLYARFFAAKEAADSGDRDLALREYLWFFNHVLEEDRSFYGVRLSYVLAAWTELAAVYSPAREAFVATRDAKVGQMLAGEGDDEVFHDVEALNRHLDPRATYDLFLELRNRHPDLARSCGRLVWQLIAQYGEAALAREYLDDPEREIRVCADILNSCASKLPSSERSRRAILKPVSSTWAERARLLLHVLTATGDAAEADRLRSHFMNTLDDSMVRQLVTKHLAAAA
jgi:hypothetical protein